MTQPKTSYRVRLVLEKRTDQDAAGKWIEENPGRAFELHREPVKIHGILSDALNREMELIYALSSLEREA